MILIASYPEDAHGTAVETRLKELKVPCHRLSTRDLGPHGRYAINPLDPGFARNLIFSHFGERPADGGSLPMKVSGIYWRRPVQRDERMTMAFPTAAEIARVEAWNAFRLAVESLPDELFPLGHPVTMESSANKLLQLNLAARTGFKVPETIVANDPVGIGEFLGRHPRVVVKPLHAAACYDEADRSKITRLLWCRGLDSSALLARLSPDKPSQLLVQQAVKKQADWRITVLPQGTICCEIETAGLSDDEPDWRKSTMSLPHRIIPVEPEFERLLRAFLRALRLPAGYFDFAVDHNGTPWFLEMNTNAQWLWIEELTGFPISMEVAKALAGLPGK